MYRSYLVLALSFWVSISSSVVSGHDSTQVFARRSSAHKKRLEFDKRLGLGGGGGGGSLKPGDSVFAVGQDSNGLITGFVNGATTTFPVRALQTQSSCGPLDLTCILNGGGGGGAPSLSSSSTPTPPLSSIPTPPPSSAGSSGSLATVPPSSSSDSGSPSSSKPSDNCLLGLLCGPSSSSTQPPASSQSDSGSSSQGLLSSSQGLLSSSQGLLSSSQGLLSSSPSSSGSTVATPPPSSQSNGNSPSQSSPSTSSSTDCGLLGGFIGGLLGGGGCGPSSSNPPNQGPSTTPPATSQSVDGSLSLNLPVLSSSSSGPATTPPPSSQNDGNSPSQSSSSGSSSADCGLLGGFIGGLLGGGCGQSSKNHPNPGHSTTPPASSSDTVGFSVGFPVLSSSSPGTVTTPPPSSQNNGNGPSSSDCGLLGGLFGSCGSAPSTTPLNIGSQPPSNGQVPSSSSNCLLGIGCGPSPSTPLQIGSTPPTNPPSFSPSSSGGASSPIASPPSTGSSRLSSPNSSIPSIVFPSGPSNPASSTVPSSIGIPLASPATSTSSFPSVSQPAWLTGSSLAVQSSSSSTRYSLTNPDQVLSTAALVSSGSSAAPSQPPLPSGLPARIVPRDGGVNSSTTDLNGYSMISVLFDSGLNWNFVVASSTSPIQILTWFPPLLQNSLQINASQVLTFALQVFIPNTYTGPVDVDQLGTLWLGYIPTSQVSILAQLIKARQSTFYTGSPEPYQSLAQHVNPSFNIDTVNNPSTNPGSSGSGSSVTGSGSSNSKSREDAIIGVVSALGGITLIVLGLLTYRAFQRRKELAHHRLSDSINETTYMGEAPANRDFDQDSVGGQRRRSFYFAQDSLRIYTDEPGRAGASAMSDSQGLSRRAVAPAAISAPVMKANSLNF